MVFSLSKFSAAAALSVTMIPAWGAAAQELPINLPSGPACQTQFVGLVCEAGAAKAEITMCQLSEDVEGLQPIGDGALTEKTYIYDLDGLLKEEAITSEIIADLEDMLSVEEDPLFREDLALENARLQALWDAGAAMNNSIEICPGPKANTPSNVPPRNNQGRPTLTPMG